MLHHPPHPFNDPRRDRGRPPSDRGRPPSGHGRRRAVAVARDIRAFVFGV